MNYCNLQRTFTAYLIAIHKMHSRKGILTQYILIISLLLCLPISKLAAEAPPISITRGTLLLATDQLNGSSFQKTVILVTHFSEKGATGLAINRPSNIPLNQAFPRYKDLSRTSADLFLGGPVRTDAVFVLLQTEHPQNGMYNIAENIYFTSGISLFAHGKKPLSKKIRAYAGYSGWAAGQLQLEIHRGDWKVIPAKPGVIFGQNQDKLWQQLHRSWSGNWI